MRYGYADWTSDMPESALPEKTVLEAMASSTLEKLGEPLSRLGRRWAESLDHPRPAMLRLWHGIPDGRIANPCLIQLRSRGIGIGRSQESEREQSADLIIETVYEMGCLPRGPTTRERTRVTRAARNGS